MMVGDGIIFLKVYLISAGLQLLAWPWLWRVGEKLTDRGWALGRLFLGLIVALIIWELGYLGIRINSGAGVSVVILGIIGAGLWKTKKKDWKSFSTWWKQKKLFILTEELLFLLGFGGLVLVRGFQPDIVGLEKFMDFGLVKSYLTSTSLPGADVWFAGESINYYSFGHFWTSVMVRIWGVRAEVGYNLMLGFILGLSLMLSFSLILNLLDGDRHKLGKVRQVFSGLIGSLLVSLGGNSHVLWSLFKNGGWEKYWYPDATRFIEKTIHEFPGYSFVVSDLHGHVLNLPVVLAFMLVLVWWWKMKRNGQLLILGILLGIMAMTNTWDVAVYGLLLSVLGGLLWWQRKIDLKRGLRVAAWVLVVAGLIAVSWWVEFEPISTEIKSVLERSPLWQLGVLWGSHLLMVAASLWLNVKIVTRKKKTVWKIENFVLLALALTALILLLLPELVYVKDIYSGHKRANTMFKLTYQAFVVMGIVAGVVMGQILGHKEKLLRLVGVIVLMLVFGGLMIYPSLAFKAYYGGFKKYRGLDGLAWFKKKYPGYQGVIDYLERERDEGENLVEAVGDSYSEFNGVSAFSGVPTIAGWKVHEWLWRGSYDPVGLRVEAVRQIYEDSDEVLSQDLLNSYAVAWIVVGENERKTYRINEAKLSRMGRVIYEVEGVRLIKVE